MNTPVIAFFNNKGGVGKTTLVYHLAWMYANLGLQVVVADLDPQANLTAAFLDEERLEDLWPDGDHPNTIFGCIQPLRRGIGDIADPHPLPHGIRDITDPHLEDIENGPQRSLFKGPISLLVGDLLLSSFEDNLSDAWPRCLDRDERSFRIMSAFWRIIQKAASDQKANIILIDLGPNLGAINRAALIAADHVVVPLSPDLFSLQGLRNLGPTLRTWRTEWQDRLARNPVSDLSLPGGHMLPAGYIVLQHAVRMDRPVKAYDRWIARIPGEYREHVLEERRVQNMSIKDDPYCLSLLKHYRSLMPLAQEAKKPMFYLKPADGALGSHMQAVQGAFYDFRNLAQKIATQTHIKIPPSPLL